MAGLEEFLGGAGLNLGGGGFLQLAITILLISVVLGVGGLTIWWIFKRRKKWNLKVIFKIPRNVRQLQDGSIDGSLNKEIGKGFYNSREGVVYLKRNKKKPVPMKPFDIKRYLSNGNILEVLQLGMDDYRPVLDDSYLEVIDEDTGEEGALIKAKIDTSESRSWRAQFEREAKLAYSIKNWLQQHGDKIALGFVVLIVLVGQAIVIGKLR